MELEARGDDWERLSAELWHWRQRGLASSNAGFLRDDGDYQPVEQLYVGNRHLCDLTIEDEEVRLVFAPSLSSSSTIRVKADDLIGFLTVLKDAIVLWENDRQKIEDELYRQTGEELWFWFPHARFTVAYCLA